MPNRLVNRPYVHYSKNMKELEFAHFKNRDEFRNWLLNHHDTSPGIWMIFYKKHTKAACILYEEALDEALCLGWIDSLVKKIDDDKFQSPCSNLSKTLSRLDNQWEKRRNCENRIQESIGLLKENNKLGLK